MIDPDAPAPRLETHRHLPGSAGPWLHAMWTNCIGGCNSSSTAVQVVEYHGPTPPTGSHRYIFVLFEQTGDGDGKVKVRSVNRKRWDFRQFLVDNPHLKAKAINYFYCSRERV